MSKPRGATKGNWGQEAKYNPDLLKFICPIMEDGGSIAEVCAKLDISLKTHCEWKKNHPEYCIEIEKGEAKSQAWWAVKGKLSLNNKEFQYGIYSFNMRNRFGWRIKDDIMPAITINADNKSSDEVVDQARAIAEKIRKEKD